VLEAAGYGLAGGPLLPTIITGAVAAATDPARRRTGCSVRSPMVGRRTLRPTPVNCVPRQRTPAGSWTAPPGPRSACRTDHILISARGEDGRVRWFGGGRPSRCAGARRNPDRPDALRALRVDGAAVCGADEVTGLDVVGAQYITIALRAAEAAGILRWCLESVVAYLKVREQFGRPIGAFQALQHKAAQLFVHSELATAAAWDAVRAMSQAPAQQPVAAAGRSSRWARFPSSSWTR
jgi:hypothetical protein